MSAARGVGARTSLVVLVVEDDEGFRDAAVALLTSIGYKVEIARDGAEALRRASAVQPDVVLLDLNMPRIDGWEVLRRLRALENGKRPHVIVSSANDDARSRQLAFEWGCDQYIVKTGARALETAVTTFFMKRNGTFPLS